MSKWVNKKAFSKFQDQKKEEQEKQSEGSGLRRSDYVWKTPEKGTAERPKTYVGRFLQDKNGIPYKRYYYHMFRSGENWVFIICPKTDGIEKYCPWCSVVSKLYKGTPADKKAAYNYKRKEKFVGNFYIVEDPRDSEVEDDNKVEKTVKLYEFPGKVETLLKAQIVDTKYGLGYSIFDPGEDGYDFILKVASTKRDANGNIWPDYSASTFVRKSYALADTDKGIEEIMEKTFDLNEYVENMKRDNDYILKSLKNEHLFDYIEEEWKRFAGSIEVSEESKEREKKEEEEIKNDSGNIPEEANNDDDDDISDEELLKELDGM